MKAPVPAPRRSISVTVDPAKTLPIKGPLAFLPVLRIPLSAIEMDARGAPNRSLTTSQRPPPCPSRGTPPTPTRRRPGPGPAPAPTSSTPPASSASRWRRWPPCPRPGPRGRGRRSPSAGPSCPRSSPRWSPCPPAPPPRPAPAPPSSTFERPLTASPDLRMKDRVTPPCLPHPC